MSADDDTPIPAENTSSPTGSTPGDTPIPAERLTPTGKAGPDSEPLRTVQGTRGEATRHVREGTRAERTVDLPLSEGDS
jgi:hypothetical protein